MLYSSRGRELFFKTLYHLDVIFLKKVIKSFFIEKGRPKQIRMELVWISKQEKEK
jgi:hypothetical protein